MAAPTKDDAAAYLTACGLAAADPDVTRAFNAEKAAQARRCRVPADADWDADYADLTEALFRRVAVNLGIGPLPLAVQASISEGGVATNKVGGGDPEVSRLEAPHRRLVVG